MMQIKIYKGDKVFTYTNIMEIKVEPDRVDITYLHTEEINESHLVSLKRITEKDYSAVFIVEDDDREE